MIQFGKGDASNTSRMQSHTRSTFPFRRKHVPKLIKEKIIVDLGLKLFELCNSHQLQQSRTAHKSLQS